jgi:uncharacterized Zn-binding protein involved in type VI secretion
MAEKHIGSQESQYMVISTAPDVCMVGIVPVPFDSFQDLSHIKSYVTNVRARGKPILTVGSVIAGTQSNAGKGISSGTSLGNGDCTIITGVPHIKCKGMPVARQDSLVAMNNGNTVGKLYTQINPANHEIPVTGNLSLWEIMGQTQRQQAEAELEASRQMPDILEGMGKGFVNGWCMLGHMLGKAGMLNGEIEADQQMAMMNVMGIDTGNIEAASILNTAVLAEIDTSEKLFELDNQAQEVGANAEAALELLFLVKGLTQGAVKIAGRAGRSGVKVVKNGENSSNIAKKINHAQSPLDTRKLKDYYRQAEKYGAAGTKELQNGKYRFYSNLTPAKKAGDMAGGRLVREWDSETGKTRTWYETLDHDGNIRSVAPKPVTNDKNHHIFSADGNYKGRR